jgi:hypothetical protein
LECETCSIETTGLRYQCVSAHREAEIEKESKFIQTDSPPPPPPPSSKTKTMTTKEAFNHLTNNSCGTSPNSESTETGTNSGLRDTIQIEEDESCIAAPLEYSNHVQPEPKHVNHGKARTSNNRHDTRSGHARTHKIIINLDDKERFTEEVIV